jgi:uncharacterized membrane protein YbhN (UPF0104 family)
MSRKIKFQLIFGIIITVVIIYFSCVIARNLKMDVVFKLKIKWGLVVLSVIIYIISNYIRGLAYSRGIEPEMDDMTSLQVIGLGHALNMVLPLHAGEGLRAAFFPSSFTGARRTKLILISILADAVVVIIISALTVPFTGIKDPTMLRVMWILLFSCIGVLAVMAVLIIFVRAIREYVQQYLKLSLLKSLVWVALSWIILIAAFWLGLAAFGFRLLESVRMSFAVFVTTNIVNLIPASPGGIGLFEYGTVVGLGGFGVDRTVALSASLLLHLIQYLALVPLGIFLYVRAMHGKYAESIRGAWKKNKKGGDTGSGGTVS